MHLILNMFSLPLLGVRIKVFLYLTKALYPSNIMISIVPLLDLIIKYESVEFCEMILYFHLKVLFEMLELDREILMYMKVY